MKKVFSRQGVKKGSEGMLNTRVKERRKYAICQFYATIFNTRKRGRRDVPTYTLSASENRKKKRDRKRKFHSQKREHTPAMNDRRELTFQQKKKKKLRIIRACT